MVVLDDAISGDTLSSTSSGDNQPIVELGNDFVGFIIGGGITLQRNATAERDT